MVQWAAKQPPPNRVVDPGCGSGRFLVAAGREFPQAALVGVDIDPLACLLCRAHLAAAGLADRSEVRMVDYRELRLPPLPPDRSTLFIGNPPYVRHHLVEPRWKAWLARRCDELGLHCSALAGLHVYFLIATAALARPGDCACFITAGEWLDVNYGRIMRKLFLDLGGRNLVIVEPTAQPFPDAATTATILCMKPGAPSHSIAVRRAATIQDLGTLDGGKWVRRERVESESRWSCLTRSPRRPAAGLVELGEICRVHRGQVTGCNQVWIAGHHSADLPDSVLFPTVTRARELYAAGHDLGHFEGLRQVIDIPVDLDTLSKGQRKAVEQFLAVARRMGADKGYIAQARKAWWSVGLRDPAPILATYMARRPPAFVLNTARARHLNIAHGLYPRQPLSQGAMINLVRYLSCKITQADGRTYAGGLTKFEPREMERLLVPDLDTLQNGFPG